MLIAAWRRGLNDCNRGTKRERERRGRKREGQETEGRFQKTSKRLTETIRLYHGTLIIIRQRYT